MGVIAPAPPPVRLFSCGRGHTYEGFRPWGISVRLGYVVKESKPLCPLCYQSFLEEQFSVVGQEREKQEREKEVAQ